MEKIITGSAEIYIGDCRDILPTLPAGFADCCIADPPYGDTSLVWDKKCKGWIDHVARALKPNGSLWVFGSLRFLAPTFGELEAVGFKYSQDIVWEKQNGTGFHNDRFRRVHEHAVLFYRGRWSDCTVARRPRRAHVRRRFDGKRSRRTPGTLRWATTRRLMAVRCWRDRC